MPLARSGLTDTEHSLLERIRQCLSEVEELNLGVDDVRLTEALKVVEEIVLSQPTRRALRNEDRKAGGE